MCGYVQTCVCQSLCCRVHTFSSNLNPKPLTPDSKQAQRYVQTLTCCGQGQVQGQGQEAGGGGGMDAMAAMRRAGVLYYEEVRFVCVCMCV